jgi:2,4-dienoyl-CoA reductase-like NADH-dependent reductase (Old Yellow Enzyme family)
MDFIELSGGTYEQLQFHHVKESTKKREAFFLEFAKNIKPKVKSAKVYLTGGFRTLPAMVRAVESNETDGVGLGRPVTAEPDIAKKLLKEGVQSVALTHYDYDIITGLFACATQMGQAGNTTIEEANNDPCHGIVDLSDTKAADAYREALVPFLQKVEELGQKGKTAYGIFEYEITSNNQVRVQA